MKSLSVTSLLLLVFSCFGCNSDSKNDHSQDHMVSVGTSREPLTDELLPFIPEGYTPILLERGDLNKDGLEDYFVVLQTLIPENLGKEKLRELNRRLNSPSLIIIRQKDNSLRVHTKNEKAILQGYALGINGEELKVIADSLGGGFTISYVTKDLDNQGLYSIDDYNFSYDQATDSFYLNHIKEEFGVLKPELHPELMATTAKDYKPKFGEFYIESGTIPFGSFDFIKYIEAGGPHHKNNSNP